MSRKYSLPPSPSPSCPPSLPPSCTCARLPSSPLAWNACAFASYGGLAAGKERDREGFQSLGGEIKEEVGLHVAAVGRNRSTGSDALCGNSRARCVSAAPEDGGGRKKKTNKTTTATTTTALSCRRTPCSDFMQADFCTSAISLALSFTDLVPPAAAAAAVGRYFFQRARHRTDRHRK